MEFAEWRFRRTLMCLPKCIRLGPAEPEGRTSSRDPKEPKQPRKKRGGTNQAETLRAFSDIEPLVRSSLSPPPYRIKGNSRGRNEKKIADHCPYASNDRLKLHYVRDPRGAITGYASHRRRHLRELAKGSTDYSTWHVGPEATREEGVFNVEELTPLEPAGRESTIVAIHCVLWTNIRDPSEFLEGIYKYSH